MQHTLANITGTSPHRDTKPGSQLLQDMEEIDNQMKRLLARHETALNDQEIHRDIEILEHWLESYRRGIAVATEITDTGTAWLADLRDRLKLAAEEMQRMEDEGGAAADKEQLKKSDDLLKVVHRIDNVLPNIDQLFVHKGAL